MPRGSLLQPTEAVILGITEARYFGNAMDMINDGSRIVAYDDDSNDNSNNGVAVVYEWDERPSTNDSAGRENGVAISGILMAVWLPWVCRWPKLFRYTAWDNGTNSWTLQSRNRTSNRLRLLWFLYRYINADMALTLWRGQDLVMILPVILLGQRSYIISHPAIILPGRRLAIPFTDYPPWNNYDMIARSLLMVRLLFLVLRLTV